jgi:hypothetical protein
MTERPDKKLNVWFKKGYYLPLFGAIIVGLYTFLPFAFSIARMGEDFQWIWPVHNEDSIVYLARAHEIIDGHFEINQPFYFENKNIAFPQSALGEFFLAGLSSLLHLSLPAIQFGLEFILPALIYFLTFLLFRRFNCNKYLSFFLPLIFFTVITGGLGKAINPQLSLPVLLFFLILLADIFSEENSKKVKYIFLGLCLGVSFLLYFYNWSLMLVILGIVGLFLIFAKEHQKLKNIIIFSFFGFIIGSPYFYLVIKGLTAPFHDETALRIGVYYSHWLESMPRLAVAIVWLLFFCFAIWKTKKLNNKKAQFILILLIVNIIYPNHQVITGIIIQNANHWSWMPILIYALSAHFLLGELLRGKNFSSLFKKENRLPITLSAFTIFLLVIPAYRLATFNFSGQSFFKCQTEKLQYYQPIFSWLQKNTDRDSVVLSDKEVSLYIPVYTHNNVYFHQHAFYYPGSDREVFERAILYNFFNKNFFNDGVYGMSADKRIIWTQAAMNEYNTHWLYRLLGWRYQSNYSLEKEKMMVEQVGAELLEKKFGIGALNKFRLDYIIWDKNLNPDWDVLKYKELQKVFEVNNVIIFRNKKI